MVNQEDIKLIAEKYIQIKPTDCARVRMKKIWLQENLIKEINQLYDQQTGGTTICETAPNLREKD